MTLFMKKVNSAITRIKIETFLCHESRNLRATWYLAWNLSVVTLVKDHSQFFKKMISHSGTYLLRFLLAADVAVLHPLRSWYDAVHVYEFSDETHFFWIIMDHMALWHFVSVLVSNDCHTIIVIVILIRTCTIYRWVATFNSLKCSVT